MMQVQSDNEQQTDRFSLLLQTGSKKTTKQNVSPYVVAERSEHRPQQIPPPVAWL